MKDYQALQKEALEELEEVLRYDADHENVEKPLYKIPEDGSRFLMRATAIDGYFGFVKFNSRVTGDNFIVEKDYHNEQFKVYKEVR